MKRSILWVLGPSEKFSSGIGIHSLGLISWLRARGVSVEVASIEASARSWRRYLWQFLVLPFVLLFGSARRTVVLYEEFYAFLIPFVKLGGGRAYIILHHVPESMMAERMQSLSLLAAFREWLLRSMMLFLRVADGVLSPSEFTRAAVVQKKLVPLERTSVVYSPFTPPPQAKMGKERRAAEVVRPDRVFTLVNVGSEESRKNVVTLIRAIASFPSGRLRLIRVGRPVMLENRREIENEAARAGVDVEFLQDLSEDDLYDNMLRGDVYVAPSLYEGFGRTVIEAQALGLPVIASKIPVCEEVLRDSALLVSDPEKVEAWAHVLEDLLADRIDLGCLIALGAENWRRFEVDRCGEALCEVLGVALTDRG